MVHYEVLPWNVELLNVVISKFAVVSVALKGFVYTHIHVFPTEIVIYTFFSHSIGKVCVVAELKLIEAYSVS